MIDSPSPAPGTSNPSPAVGRMVARERLRAMEALAGVIAHEIRSSVLGVTSAAQLLRYALPQDPVAEKSLGRILQESDRLSALHEALNEYATELPPRLAAGNPDALLAIVLDSMRGALEANSVLMTHQPAGDDPSVLMDEAQLTRAFERLVHHAIARGRAGCELRIVSSIEGPEWHSTMSVIRSDPGDPAGDRNERPAFQLALADRTIVAHGGETIDHSGDRSARVVSVHLPLAPDSQ